MANSKLKIEKGDDVSRKTRQCSIYERRTVRVHQIVYDITNLFGVAITNSASDFIVTFQETRFSSIYVIKIQAY